jgi:hypothetical protein
MGSTYWVILSSSLMNPFPTRCKIPVPVSI